MQVEDSTKGRQRRLPERHQKVISLILRVYDRDLRRVYGPTEAGELTAAFHARMQELSELTGLPRRPTPGEPCKTYDTAFYRKAIRALGAGADGCGPVRELLRLADELCSRERARRDEKMRGRVAAPARAVDALEWPEYIAG